MENSSTGAQEIAQACGTDRKKVLKMHGVIARSLGEAGIFVSRIQPAQLVSRIAAQLSVDASSVSIAMVVCEGVTGSGLFDGTARVSAAAVSAAVIFFVNRHVVQSFSTSADRETSFRPCEVERKDFKMDLLAEVSQVSVSMLQKACVVMEPYLHLWITLQLVEQYGKVVVGLSSDGHVE